MTDLYDGTIINDHNLSGNEVLQDSDDKKLLRKLDLHLIPTMTLLYLLSFLDRVNIGQAKLNGLLISLKLSSIEYNTCLSVFFITYVAFEIPSNLILKKIRPSRWLPLIMVAWGTVMTCMGLVHSYQSLLVCRLLLGVTESGLFTGKYRSTSKMKIFFQYFQVPLFICLVGIRDVNFHGVSVVFFLQLHCLVLSVVFLLTELIKWMD
jgi:sugar phosphate permease